MHFYRPFSGAAFCLAIAVTSASAQSQGARVASYVDSVTTAFARGDTAGALSFLETALRQSPHNPVFLDGMVRMRGRVRDSAGVLSALARLAATGGGRPVRGEAIFGFIAGFPEFERLAYLHDTTLTPVRRSDSAVVIRDTTIATEAIAVDADDPAGLTVYANGGGGRIIRVRGQGEAQTIDTLAETGGNTMLGMRIDGRRRLWVAVSFTAADSAQRSRSELIAVDLGSGKIVRRYRSPNDGRNHLFNDIAIDSRGTVYVTDFDAHALYTAPAGSDTLRMFHANDPWFSRTNGIVLSPDGRRLYVAHFDGVTVWDLSRGTRAMVTAPRTVSLVNIDGLYVCGRSLIGVQTLPGAGRVVRFDLDATGTSVTGHTVLDRDAAISRRVSTGYSVGNALYFPARVLPPRARQTVVHRVGLSPGCR
jgi:sugar lactone lactonase YvrE